MARELTTVEAGLDSFAIRSAVKRAGKPFTTEDYGAIKAGAKLDAEKLVNGWREDTKLAEIIAQHVDENSLAQAINYHALIHARLIIFKDPDDPEDADVDESACPICGSLLR